MLFSFLLLSSTAFLLYHIFNRLSSTFFKFFKKLFQHSRFKMSVIRQPIYYITSFRACQVVFKKVFYLIFSEVIFHYLFQNQSNFLHSFTSYLRFLGFCCRSLTTVIIISQVFPFVKPKIVQISSFVLDTFTKLSLFLL